MPSGILLHNGSLLLHSNVYGRGSGVSIIGFLAFSYPRFFAEQHPAHRIHS
jgi:hypothetical protein